MGDFSVPFSLSLSFLLFFFLNFSHPLLQLLNSAERKLQLCWHFLSEVVKIPIAIVSNSASLAAGQVYRLANFDFSRLLRVAFLFFHSNTQRTPLSDHRATFPVDTDDLLPRYRRSNAAYFDQLYRWRATPLGGGGEIRIECHGANYEFSVYKNFSTERYQIWPNRVFQLKLKLTLFWLAAWITGCCFCCRGITIFFCFETLYCCCCCCCSSCSFLLLKA